MKKVTVREILAHSYNDVYYNFNDKSYIVIYDNNEENETFRKEIIMNRYLWSLFDLYPNTPIVKECCISTLTRNSYYNADIHIKMLEKLFKYICKHNNLLMFEQKEALVKHVYNIVNLIYNDLLIKIFNYIPTVDAVDFIQVVEDENIKRIHSNIKPNQDSIENAYKEIKQVLIENTNYNNRFIHAYKSKAVNENQSNQCIGPRGFISDLDRSVYKQPVLSGFIKGLNTLFELIAESRTAAKALNASDNHIKTSEYTSRRLQLLSMSVRNVVFGDCGSDEYFSILITEDTLPNLRGKYYLNEETNTLNIIQGNEKELLNKIIKIRTTLGCRLPKNNEICSTCLGELANNFRSNSNLGYTFVSYLMEKATQSILSTKHLTHSVKKSISNLEGNATRFFYINRDNYIFFNKETNTKGLKLVLYSSQVNKLVDALSLSNSNISLSKIGEITDISIVDTNHKVPNVINIDLSYKERNCIITKEFFNYIKNNYIETDSRGNFIIPLDDFNKDHPVFYNPIKEKDIITFVYKLAKIIETNVDKVTDPYEKLDILFNHVIKQFTCNISILEVIIYATTVYNAFDLNYRLGRNSPNKKTNTESNIFRHRNISQMFVFEDQVKTLFNNGFNIFDNRYKQHHPFDILFVPDKILK